MLIDKPAGITSHGVISYLRKITGIKRIGHAGTLDPFATGLLIVGVGREATRELDRFLKQDKEYEANIQLGATSDTQDLDGAIKNNPPSTPLSRGLIDDVVFSFVGEQEQMPPMYSAKKIKGKKLYELARKGIEVERQPNRINVYRLEIKSFVWPDLTIKTCVSSGTYIRTLGADIGEKLGVGGYLTALRRTAIGKHNVSAAHQLEDLTVDNWQSKLVQLK